MRKKPSSAGMPKPGTVDAEHTGRAQQTKHVVLVGAPGRQRQLRHDVEAGDRRDARHAGHRVEMSCGDVGARSQLRAEDRLMRTVAEQRFSDGELHRHGAAQPAVRHLLDRGERVVEPRRAADAHPAGPPARREVGLRQTREGDDRRVGIQLADRIDGAVVSEIAVHLVGEDHQVVALGKLDQFAPRRRRIRRAGRVVRIDDDEDARRRRDEALQVIEIGLPSAGRIGAIELRACVDLRQDRGVQRIGRHRHEHFAAAVHEGAQHEVDRFGRACGNERAVGRHRKTA